MRKRAFALAVAGTIAAGAAWPATALPAAAAPRQASPPYARRRPAIWVVNDHDTTIYLFGTFHASTAGRPGSTTKSETAFGGGTSWCARPSFRERIGEVLKRRAATVDIHLAATRLDISAVRRARLQVGNGADSSCATPPNIGQAGRRAGKLTPSSACSGACRVTRGDRPDSTARPKSARPWPICPTSWVRCSLPGTAATGASLRSC